MANVYRCFELTLLQVCHAHLKIAERLRHDVLTKKYGIIYGKPQGREHRTGIVLVVEHAVCKLIVGLVSSRRVELEPEVGIVFGFAVDHLVETLVELVKCEIYTAHISAQPI